jgi:hypothetical protein
MGDFSANFERGQTIGVRLAGASMTETAMLLVVSRTAVSEVMLAYRNHGKTSGERNNGRKSISTGRDCYTLRRIVLKNYRTTAAQGTRAELNIHLEAPDFTRTGQCELHRSNIMAGLQLLNLCILKVMLRDA